MCDKENSYQTRLSLDAVREFLIRHNGKVKQDDLVDYFRAELINPSTKVRARQEFKDILQLITAVKTENGEKYILLTKQNQDHFQASLISRKSKRSNALRREARNGTAEYLKTSFLAGGLESSNITAHSTVPDEERLSTKYINRTEVTSNEPASERNGTSSKETGSAHVFLLDEDLVGDIGLNVREEVKPIEKDWMFASSRGNINELRKLVRTCPELLNNKDFIFGYTTLHWAAKLGRSDIIAFIRENGMDINAKSHGGYTALHLAAINGKEDIIVQLINLGAGIHVRDHSGRKPKDLVNDIVTSRVQRLLGKIKVNNTNTLLQSHMVNVQGLQRAKNTSTPFSNSDGENSPDFARRSFKSAQRSISFLKKKINSPLVERAKTSIVNMTSPRTKTTTPTLERKSSNPSFYECGFPLI